MKHRYTLWSVACLLASVPMVVHLVHRRSANTLPVVRFATFDVGLQRGASGALLDELRGGAAVQARRIAEIVQRAEVDVLLLCEVDHDTGAEVGKILARQYFAVPQAGLQPIDFEFAYAGPVNAGEPSGQDLDGDGRSDGPGDVYGPGAFAGQGGMLLLSRHPILVDQVRTFRTLPWRSMPAALRPAVLAKDEVWQQVRLSSKSLWDVPIGVGKQVVHVLCSHASAPLQDGPGDLAASRNHDEVRFWVDYLTPERAGWIVDDAGVPGGLPASAAFVVMGNLNCDPKDGNPKAGELRRDALLALLGHARIQDPEPKSAAGTVVSLQQWGSNATHAGDPALDTADFPDLPLEGAGGGPGNLRVDYVLPAREFVVSGRGVYWPLAHESGGALVGTCEHRLVWVDVQAH